jgi:cyclophilin family peptidyl-prolyl cis-trans isomerase
MSNKTLIITIVAILAVFAAGVFVIRKINSNKAAKQALLDEQAANQAPPPEAFGSQSQQPASSAPAVVPTSETPSSTPADTAVCKRDFDQNKLNTAKVGIQNRTAQISVKGFGNIELQFYDKDAPKAVENFLRLANAGFYDCLTFHRVAKGFVIQGGDPKGNGSGGQSAFGQPFSDELNPDTPSYKAGYVKGVLAMANSGPNTNGSQFFIMLGDVPLDHKYTIFGKVTAGQGVVDKIGQVEIKPVMGPTDGTPVTPVIMQSVKIIK